MIKTFVNARVEDFPVFRYFLSDISHWVPVHNFGGTVILFTVIPRLTSDPANDFFRLTKNFFRCFLDSANECFSGCAR